MSPRDRRQYNQNRQRTLAIKKPYTPPTKGARIFLITTSISIIFVFLYLALRDNSIPEKELSKIFVTLIENPRYNEHKIKSTTYRAIILTTKEYKCDFQINAMTYKAIDHSAFKANVFAGDKVELKVKKSELDDLNESTFWKKYNDVYGLSKDDNSYIDNELRTELTNKDGKWSYFFVILGFVMLPYGFIKSKPLISMDKAITTAVILGFIIMLIISWI